MATFFVNTEDAKISNAFLATLSAAPGATFLAQIKTIGLTSATQQMIAATGQTTAAGLANTVATNLGLTGAALDAGKAYLTSVTFAGASSTWAANLLSTLDLFAGLQNDPVYGAAAEAHVKRINSAVAYSSVAANNSTDLNVLGSAVGAPGTNPSQTFTLTTGRDSLLGTSGNDSFEGYVVGNGDTLNSGDSINGGDGTDSLTVVLGSASDFAITPRTTNLEQVFIRSQSTNSNGSSGENNVDGDSGQQNTIDAQDMVGVRQWHNVDSRADLVIEDVRILDSQITRDITIRMSNTDPGTIGSSGATRSDSHPDFELYFSPESLRRESSVQTDSIVVSISNQLEVARGFDASKPLDNVPYNQLRFSINGQEVTVGLDLTQVDTYAQLETALKAGLSANTQTKDIVVVRNISAQTFSAADGSVRTADTFTLTLSGSKLAETPIGWSATGGLPSDNAFRANVDPGTGSATNPLITSTIILDNVGRESESGSLIVGSMSTRTGVERFEITVENNSNTSGSPTQGVNTGAAEGNPTSTANAKSGSWLQSIGTTNNMLREVTAVNAASGSSDPDYLYIGSGQDSAGNNLTVLRNAPTLLNADGMTDVRLFDASSMTGDVKLGAAINEAAVRKYQNLVDTATSATADTVAFDYKTGSGNDSVNLLLDGAVVASRSLIVPGRNDFTFSVNTGTGNDTIRLQIGNGLTGGGQNWYVNQDINNNITVDGGAGNDTILTFGAGDVVIRGGDGNDTAYTDNSGNAAVFVYNNAAGSLDLNDLRSDTAATAVSGVNAQLRVSFRGIESGLTTIGNSLNSLTNVAIDDLSINQAIKDAVNNNSVLNKLIVAEDGPARTLIVRSLVDGASVTGDLGVTFSTAALSTAQTNLPAANAVTLWNSSSFATRYATEIGTIGATVQAGTDSVTTSDNTITGGAGSDVIVLSTTVGADTQGSSNEQLVFGASFGDDTVVNFDATGNGIDTIDFASIGGAISGANFGSFSLASSIVVAAETTANDTASEVAALFTDAATAKSHVYVAFNSSNIAKVYQVSDAAGTGTGNVTAVLQGSIDLADTLWSSLTAANFAAVANTGTGGGGGGGGGGGAATVVNVSAGASVDAAGGNFAYTFASGTYTYNVANFAAGDKLDFPDAVAASVNNTSFTDGTVQLTWANSGQNITVNLTGIPLATDAQLFSVSSFNTVYGAGTVV